MIFKENRKITSAPWEQRFCYTSSTRVALMACSVNTCFSRAAFFFPPLFKPPNTSRSSPEEGTRSRLGWNFLRKSHQCSGGRCVRIWDVMGFCLHCTVLLLSRGRGCSPTSLRLQSPLPPGRPAAPVAHPWPPWWSQAGCRVSPWCPPSQTLIPVDGTSAVSMRPL